MTSNLTTINENSKLALAKSKNLLDITNKILSKKDIKDLVQSFSYKPFLFGKGHGSQVRTLAITPDGKYIISGGNDKTIKIWNIQSGECLKTLEGHSSLIMTLTITQDGKYIVSGSSDRTIKIWNIQSGECLKTLEGHSDSVLTLTITPDGKYIVSGSKDKTIRIWSIQSGECLKTLEGHSDPVLILTITPDGKYIVSGSKDKTIKIWNIQSGECLQTLMGHSDFAWVLAITQDGKHIVSGSEENTIKIWYIESGECLKTLKGHSDWVNTLAITPDGKHIVSGSFDNTLKIWNIKSGECLKTLEGHSSSVLTFTITQDGKYIISGSGDRTIKIWSIQSGECLKTLEGHSNFVNTLAITPDGKYIVSGSSDNTIKIWNIQSGDCIYTMDYTYEVVIDKNGYFKADNEAIQKYIRVSEAPLTQRKLTAEEIKHFRKKGNFLEIGEIIPKPKFSSVMEAKEVSSPKPHAPNTKINKELTVPNGVWLDPETNLMWQDDEDAVIVEKPWVTQHNFDEENYMDTSGDTAATYASDLSLGGYSDWRLPTRDELKDLYEKKSKLKNVSSSNYWSSTTYEYNKDFAWYVVFYNGYVSSVTKNDNNYVRCVIAGNFLESDKTSKKEKGKPLNTSKDDPWNLPF